MSDALPTIEQFRAIVALMRAAESKPSVVETPRQARALRALDLELGITDSDWKIGDKYYLAWSTPGVFGVTAA